jgi:tetratricopeptide (TPR) repeat protein
MSEPRVFPLESIRTDGWFERIGEGIGSFQALCDIVGTRFFAFAMITGARITALTVDRRSPDNTMVDFVVGAPSDAEISPADAQRLTLADFRRRLVSALVQEEPMGPLPTRATDVEALQMHIGVRYLLLAPLYGYSLKQLTVEDGQSNLELLHDGVEEGYQLSAFRARLRTHVREELDRVQRGGGRGAIDLSRIPAAQAAALAGDHVKVLELLGAWPAPLAIFLRTPEGQMLGAEARASIARALGLLGSSCIGLGETEKGEEVLRLAVQYAGDGPSAPEIYTRLGQAMIEDGRPGEAISPLRRAANLGAPGKLIWPQLARAFLARERFLAAFAALLEAREAGADQDQLETLQNALEDRLSPALFEWHDLVGQPAQVAET